MGQHWLIVNIDKRSYQEHGKVVESFFGDMSQTGLLSLLEPAPAVNIPPLKMKTKQVAALKGAYATLSPFERCPVEVVDAIISNVENLQRCVYFSVTCRRHWNIGRRHIERRVRQDVAEKWSSWAGDRLIMVGEGVYWQNLPEGLLSESDKKRLGVHWGSQGAFKDQLDLYTAVKSDFSQVSASDSRIAQSYLRDALDLDLRVRAVFAGCILPDDFLDHLKLVERLLGRDFLQVPKPEPCVLRNLIKHEYVRKDAVWYFEMDNEEVLKKFERSFNLGHVVFMRIFPRDGDEDGTRCRWAGDRFDFASLADVMEMNVEGEGWKDVTREVINEMRDIWLKPHV